MSDPVVHELLRGILASLQLEKHQNNLESGNYQSFQVNHEVAERQSATPLLDMAVEWLKQHPEDMNTPNRQLAERLGMSHPWIGKAKKVIKNER